MTEDKILWVEGEKEVDIIIHRPFALPGERLPEIYVQMLATCSSYTVEILVIYQKNIPKICSCITNSIF